ncbi:Flp pilus assembly protein CpaB [Bradyrhizobium erythrophlei]|uniref:Flp pilus assembly protein CpaB n=1 Tax=Bradyrhizobium erythrophlei TaxID=1437360 RepID=UPI0035E4F035
MLAVLLGCAAAYLARNWMLAMASPPPPSGTIVVAATALGFGTVLNSDNLNEIPWPHGALPDGAFATKNELLKDGRRALLAPLARSEAVLKSKVTGPGQRASLSALLDQNQRAVTVRVDDVRGVAGFVLPGDRVDVVLIRTVERQNSRPENVSEVLLQHIKVLAVDQLVNERQEAPTVAKAVTLEVTTEQAQKVLLATNIGKLSLILRQSGAGDPTAVRPVSEDDLGAGKEVPVASVATPIPASLPATAPAPTVVEVIRSMKIERYNVIRAQ